MSGTDVDGEPSVARASLRERADGARPVVAGGAITLRSRRPNAESFFVRIASQ
jgi:hypothetical protein